MMIKVVGAPDLRIGIDTQARDTTNLGQDPSHQNTSTRNIEEIIGHDLGMIKMTGMEVDMGMIATEIETDVEVIMAEVEIEMQEGRGLTQRKTLILVKWL